MYLHQRLTGPSARAAAVLDPPIGPAMQEITNKIDTLEIFCSSFFDEDDDWCEYVAYDTDGQVIERKRFNGY